MTKLKTITVALAAVLATSHAAISEKGPPKEAFFRTGTTPTSFVGVVPVMKKPPKRPAPVATS